jgi:hypothetical protein
VVAGPRRVVPVVAAVRLPVPVAAGPRRAVPADPAVEDRVPGCAAPPGMPGIGCDRPGIEAVPACPALCAAPGAERLLRDPAPPPGQELPGRELAVDWPARGGEATPGWPLSVEFGGELGRGAELPGEPGAGRVLAGGELGDGPVARGGELGAGRVVRGGEPAPGRVPRIGLVPVPGVLACVPGAGCARPGTLACPGAAVGCVRPVGAGLPRAGLAAG